MEAIEGNIYHISLDNQTIFKGWYAIKDKMGNIYLLERHFSLSSNFWRNLYIADVSLENILTTDEQIKHHKQLKYSFRVGSIGLAIVVGTLVSHILPRELFFGQFNSHFDIKVGFINVSLTLLVTLLSIYGLVWYRKFLIRRRFPNLRKIGRVKSLTPFLVLENGKEFW